MKKILFFLMTMTLCACGQQGRMASGDQKVLGRGWQLTREGASERYDAAVPSTVCGVLAEAGYFGDDLLEGRNYAAADRTPKTDSVQRMMEATVDSVYFCPTTCRV